MILPLPDSVMSVTSLAHICLSVTNRHYVRRNGGRVVGGIFHAQAAVVIGPGQPEGTGMAKTVLIVEDNELNMKLFHDLLEAHGYATVGTRNGIEAIDLARKHRPDLILMDIQLPEVSGLEVTKWLKDDQELRRIPVVAVTAFAMKGDEERIREGGCEAYLSKPISVSKFIETIRHFLGNPQ
jgi:two-component system cell cycle response regulator DivK